MHWAAVTLASIVFALMAPQVGFAHDDVVGTTPSNGDQLARAPEEVRIQFTERPRTGRSAVIGPNGRRLARGEASVDGSELVIPMQPSREPGAYSAEFGVESSDGHVIEGTLVFEVVGQPAPAADPAVPVDGSSAEGATGLPAWEWVLPVGGAGVLAVALLVARSAVRRDRSAS